MKTEKKFTWCIRYYNVKTGNVGYHTYFDWTTSEISDLIAGFVESHKDYKVCLFKQFKEF